MATQFKICEVTWQQYEKLLREIRYQVFVCELRVNPKDEFDQADQSAWHLLAFDEETGKAIGTGRLSSRGEIGRIAVLINYRDLGIGSAITHSLLRLAQFHQLDGVSVCPELSWLNRFEQFAQPVGPVFMESGIPHQQLACQSLKVRFPDIPYLH